MKKPLVRISDHALVRYMERAMGINCERLRRELGARVDAVYIDGACGVVIDGNSFRIVKGDIGPVVTTVLDGTMGNPRIYRKGPDT